MFDIHLCHALIGVAIVAALGGCTELSRDGSSHAAARTESVTRLQEGSLQSAPSLPAEGFVRHSIFDGSWWASVPKQGSCPPAWMRLLVEGGAIRGDVENPVGKFPIRGVVDRFGNGKIYIGGYSGTVKFYREEFIAAYENNCGARLAIGHKDKD